MSGPQHTGYKEREREGVRVRRQPAAVSLRLATAVVQREALEYLRFAAHGMPLHGDDTGAEPCSRACAARARSSGQYKRVLEY